MDTNNIANGAVSFIPRPSSNDDTLRQERRNNFAAEELVEQVEAPNRVQSGDGEALAKAQQMQQSSNQYAALAQTASKEVAAYQAMQGQQQRAAISELMGVDIYA